MFLKHMILDGAEVVELSDQRRRRIVDAHPEDKSSVTATALGPSDGDVVS